MTSSFFDPGVMLNHDAREISSGKHFQHTLGRQWQIADASSGGMSKGIGNRRHRRALCAFPHTHGPLIGAMDEFDLEHRDLTETQNWKSCHLRVRMLFVSYLTA